MIPETWETWHVVVLMGFAGWAGFGLCAMLTLAKRADHQAELIAVRNRALIEGSGMGPVELRAALAGLHDLEGDHLTLADMRGILRDATAPEPMADPDNWGAA